MKKLFLSAILGLSVHFAIAQSTVGPGQPTLKDYQEGKAQMKPWGGYMWNWEAIQNFDINPLTEAEAKQYRDRGMTWVKAGDKPPSRYGINKYGENLIYDKIIADRKRQNEQIKSQMFITKPSTTPMTQEDLILLQQQQQQDAENKNKANTK